MIVMIAEQVGFGSLLITGIIGVVTGGASGWIALLLKRKELIATTLQTIEERRGTLHAETDEARQERIRAEIVRWANPMLGSVQDLSSRLINILEAEGYRALHADYLQSSEPNWSISHEYFLPSTIYLFAQYFACVRLIQVDLSFELFRSEEMKNKFFKAIRAVSSRLGRYPPPEPESMTETSGNDAQVFRLQQQAIGELMIVRDKPNQWLSYPEFLKLFHNDTEFQLHFLPMKNLLLNLNRADPNDRRHRRLRAIGVAVNELEQACKTVLSLTADQI